MKYILSDSQVGYQDSSVMNTNNSLAFDIVSSPADVVQAQLQIHLSLAEGQIIPLANHKLQILQNSILIQNLTTNANGVATLDVQYGSYQVVLLDGAFNRQTQTIRVTERENLVISFSNLFVVKSKV